MQTANLSADRITSTAAALVTEYRKRKQARTIKRIARSELTEHLEAGWTSEREMKRGVRVSFPKSHDEILENQFWVMLYLLGYSRMNVGRHLRVTVDVEGHKVHKQIDVLAIDAETVVVAECKSATVDRTRSLQKDLSEFDSVKRQIANSVRAMIGPIVKPKFLWVFVTSRIRWSANDLARAKEKNIQVIREQELRYFMEIAKTLGPSARFQFHAEFLSGQKIPALADSFVPASRFRLGGRTAYSFSISALDLLRRAFVNHRDLRDPSGAPTYQRLINPGRLKSIAGFISKGGYFANSVLVNFHCDMRFDITDREPSGDTRFGRLYLPDVYKSCWIIDGQHRIYGAAVAAADGSAPVIPVVAFEHLPAEQEANLFATINREQKQVQKKLLDELDGELKWGSDDPKEAMNAIASRSLDIMRHEVLGPFEDRIALPGMRGRQQPLTVPQLRPEIVRSQLIGRISNRDGRLIGGALTGASDEETLSNLCSFLNVYFDGIKSASIERWEGTTVALCHNIAVSGLIRLGGELVRYLQAEERIDVTEMTSQELAEQVLGLSGSLLNFIKTSTDLEYKERFPITLGSGGPKRFFLPAAVLIKEGVPNFNPDGLSQYIEETSKERVDRADRSVKWIVDALHKFVVEKLREVYGPDFFEKGIKSKDIKIKAYSKRADTDPSGSTPLETYLDVIELKKIAEASENWPHFKETLNIQLPDQQRGLAKYLKWIDDFNDIRKTFAHPYNRHYSDGEIATLDLIESSLRQRLS